MKGFLKDFKDFVCRGNVLDMAVGVIIGAAFKDIVTSLTDNIISPLIGMVGGANFDEYSVTLMGKATLNYGMFITAVINFLIMAFVVFLLVKFVNLVIKALTPKKKSLHWNCWIKRTIRSNMTACVMLNIKVPTLCVTQCLIEHRK